jgi:hypothetical protein
VGRVQQLAARGCTSHHFKTGLRLQLGLCANLYQTGPRNVAFSKNKRHLWDVSISFPLEAAPDTTLKPGFLKTEFLYNTFTTGFLYKCGGA